ncbi:MAG TPA: hypothetical protein VGO78_12550, partial [Acidimicrobiales bacterium]|nr:hypothetical protein [Acidimicrobiales bacterium]
MSTADPGKAAARRPAAALVGLAILVVVGASGAAGWTAVSRYRTRHDPTYAQAEQLGYRLASARTVDPMALARVADGRGAEVLEAEDSSPCRVAGAEVGCSTLLVRLHAQKQAGWFSGATVEVDGCWRYTLRNSIDDSVAHRADCPDHAEALSVPPAPPVPRLPDGLQDQLGLTLTGLVDAGTLDVAAVRAAVEPLSGGPPAFVDVATAAPQPPSPGWASTRGTVPTSTVARSTIRPATQSAGSA